MCWVFNVQWHHRFLSCRICPEWQDRNSRCGPFQDPGGMHGFRRVTARLCPPQDGAQTPDIRHAT